jgi:class 3 adenylate cyclase
LFDKPRFFSRIDPKYHSSFRQKIAYENAHRIVVLFYFLLAFFVLFLILDWQRIRENKADDILYELLFVSHLIFAFQLFTAGIAVKNYKAINNREYPHILRLERQFVFSMIVGQLPMAILGIFERETMVVLMVYSVMVNVIMQVSHRKAILYNSFSFVLAVLGLIFYFNSSYVSEDSSGPLILAMEILAVFSIPFFISRNHYNSKLREFEYQEILTEQNDIIRLEKEKSDDLLLNILPKEVAEELKETGHSEAHQFENVSVLFTDFVNFTTVSEHLTPKQLVAEIHYCFRAFDAIIEKYRLEKIKTIGDAYLAVSGLPTSDKNHAQRVVGAALEIREFVSKHKFENIEAQKEFLDIRIGIHSGPVVAGIVGVKKFAYDIWGDTVNTAARMEQCSDPGKITISERTYELVKESFLCIDRGKIEAKNKGKIHMYFVEGFKGEKIVELLSAATEDF